MAATCCMPPGPVMTPAVPSASTFSKPGKEGNHVHVFHSCEGRRIIFPNLYNQKEARTRQVAAVKVKINKINHQQVHASPQLKSVTAFNLQPLDKQQAKEKIGCSATSALLSSSPIGPQKPSDIAMEEAMTLPFRSVPIRPVPRPSLTLASMEISELDEESSPNKSARRSILIHHQSMPLLATTQGSPKDNTKKLDSILRNSRGLAVKMKLGSIPSLMSLKDEEDSSQSSVEVPAPALDTITKQPMRRSISEPTRKFISFDPRIWVREFDRSKEEQETTWYTEEDMATFKRHALALIMARQTTQVIATGTTRTVQRSVSAAKVFFTHSALTLEGEDDPIEALKSEKFRSAVAQNEIRNILLIDPHDICLTLFKKAFKTLLPNVELCTATTSEEALHLLGTGKCFDIILVEERLKKLFHNQSCKANSNQDHSHSGSAFLRTLSQIQNKKQALFIGVSAHLEKDRCRLKESGADLCWTKPPPKMSEELRNNLLRLLLLKRGRKTIAEELFGSS